MISTASPLLLTALTTTRPLIVSEALGRGWDAESALEGMTNGALAAHLVRAPMVTVNYLAEAEPTGAAPIDDDAYFDASIGQQPTNAPVHQQIRSRALLGAEAGHEAVRASFDEAASALQRALQEASPNRLVSVMGGQLVMRLNAYLITRLIEVVVHADDLAVSLGLPTPTFDPDIDAAVIDALIRIGRRRHGDVGVIRALTRRERDRDEALRIL